MSDSATRTPYLLCALLGLGGLFFGVTGPLLSNFIPPIVRGVLGEERTLIGLVLALDNVIMFVLVPWSGSLSDRFHARGQGRLPIVLAGLVLAAVGMAVLPASPALGLAGLLGAMVVLYAGINLMRAPFQALVADLVPSRFRSFATGSVTFQMCVGAIVFLMLGRLLGMGPAFLIAALSVLGIALGSCSAFARLATAELRPRRRRSRPSAPCSVRSVRWRAGRSPGCGRSSWRPSCSRSPSRASRAGSSCTAPSASAAGRRT